ncbi:hypothetical protein ABK040_002971 [Willaertia magna]
MKKFNFVVAFLVLLIVSFLFVESRVMDREEDLKKEFANAFKQQLDVLDTPITKQVNKKERNLDNFTSHFTLKLKKDNELILHEIMKENHLQLLNKIEGEDGTFHYILRSTINPLKNIETNNLIKNKIDLSSTMLKEQYGDVVIDFKQEKKFNYSKR